jgi:hypothetical protein
MLYQKNREIDNFNDESDLDDLSSPKSDKRLFRALVGLNLVSGITTIQGACQILSGPAGWLAGGSLQVMLLMLSSDKAASHAQKRKWLAIGVLSSASIYTSFFSYYGLMTKGKQQTTASSMATAAFVAQQAALLSPIEHEVTVLEGKIKELETARETEIKGNGPTGTPGIGSGANNLATEIEQQKRKYYPLKAVYEKIKPDFEIDLKNSTPEEILKKAQIAYSSVPSVMLGNTQKPNRNDYIDIDSSVEFLAPFNKLKRGEGDAIASLAIASFVDGMIIILATAVTIKQKNGKGFILLLTDYLAKTITDTKTLLSTVSERVEEFVPPNLREDIDTVKLENPVHLVSFQLKGRATDFLAVLYHSLNPETRVLDHSILINHPNETHRLSYRMILDELCRLGWIGWQGGQRKRFISPTKGSYVSFAAWLNHEISRQKREEKWLDAQGFMHDELERAIVLHFPKA